MPQVKKKILDTLNPEQLDHWFNHLGNSVRSDYHFKNALPVVVYTIHEALTELFRDTINSINEANAAEGKPYVNLTTWEFLETGELFIIYDVVQNIGRLPDERDREHLEASDRASLTPAGIRRWYVNRKNENEYLVSDFEGATFWVPE